MLVWDVSIRNAIDAIQRVNKRRRSGGSYLDETDLAESIDEIFVPALRHASLEAFEGRYNEDELEGMLDLVALKREVLEMLHRNHSRNDI